MANLADIETESTVDSSLTSEEDDALDPRVQVRGFHFYYSSLLCLI
jgi:hypothetical protein